MSARRGKSSAQSRESSQSSAGRPSQPLLYSLFLLVSLEVPPKLRRRPWQATALQSLLSIPALLGREPGTAGQKDTGRWS